MGKAVSNRLVVNQLFTLITPFLNYAKSILIYFFIGAVGHAKRKELERRARGPNQASDTRVARPGVLQAIQILGSQEGARLNGQ
jgi:hypothetical protein